MGWLWLAPLALFVPSLAQRSVSAPPVAALKASLKIPAQSEALSETLLKNTLDQDKPQRTENPKTSPADRAGPRAIRQETRAAQRKLSQHLFYPAEAVARGLEGEVRLILKLADDGSVDRVSLAASSGHPILDNAAVKAAYAMGRLTGAQSRELLLPVVFRLQ